VKLGTILGTWLELIRRSRILRKREAVVAHGLADSGQNGNDR